MNYSELLGKRILVELAEKSSSEVFELLVIEVSPSGKYIKTKNIHNEKYECWEKIEVFSKYFKLLEVLSNFNKGTIVTSNFEPSIIPFDLMPKTISSNSDSTSIEASFTFKESDWKKQI